MALVRQSFWAWLPTCRQVSRTLDANFWLASMVAFGASVSMILCLQSHQKVLVMDMVGQATIGDEIHHPKSAGHGHDWRGNGW